MKRSYIILSAICFTIALSGCAGQTGGNSTSAVTSQSDNKANAEGYINDDAKGYQLSENGADLTVYDSLSDKVIEGAERFIIESGCNDPEFSFGFENTPKLGSPKSAANNALDFFEPTVFEAQEDGSPYFVYQIGKDNNTYLGYFVVDNEGKIIEQNIITGDQYKNIGSEYNIDIGQAMSDMASHFSVSTQDLKNLCRYLDKTDDKYTLCYRGIFLSEDKTKKYYARMNGETGEIFYTDEVKFK